MSRTGWDNLADTAEKGPWAAAGAVAVAVVVGALFLGALGAVGRIGNKAVDRVVQKTSFQYREGMAQRGAILEAQIAQVELDISRAQTGTEREDLGRQRDVLKAQLRAITINE
ncbi:MAG: hypothetical protein QNJ97_17990 [Myxococcota bacterium]|nr:hypothetical protein [Myxococcota bacterium]